MAPLPTDWGDWLLEKEPWLAEAGSVSLQDKNNKRKQFYWAVFLWEGIILEGLK